MEAQYCSTDFNLIALKTSNEAFSGLKETCFMVLAPEQCYLSNTIKSELGLPLHQVTVLQKLSLFPSSRTSKLFRYHKIGLLRCYHKLP